MRIPALAANVISAFSATLLAGLAFVGAGRASPREADADVAAAGSVAADMDFAEDFPPGWKIVVDKPGARGWRMTGFANGALEEIAGEASGIMAAHGFSISRRVDEGQANVLVEFTSGDGLKILWMFWPQNEKKTGFAWGISK